MKYEVIDAFPLTRFYHCPICDKDNKTTSAKKCVMVNVPFSDGTEYVFGYCRECFLSNGPPQLEEEINKKNIEMDNKSKQPFGEVLDKMYYSQQAICIRCGASDKLLYKTGLCKNCSNGIDTIDQITGKLI